MQEIPLSGGAANSHQEFNVQLGDNYLKFVLNYVTYTDTPGWSLDIVSDGTNIVSGAMLVPGCDIVQNYRAGIGRLIFVGSEPTIDNLGVDNHLVWVSE